MLFAFDLYDKIWDVSFSLLTVGVGVLATTFQYLIKKNLKSSNELRQQQSDEIKKTITHQTEVISKLSDKQEEQSVLFVKTLERLENHSAAHFRTEREQIAIRQLLNEHSEKLANHAERIGRSEEVISFLKNNRDQ